MALTAPDSLILNALSQGISPVTGFPLSINDLNNEDVKNALQAGAKALIAASQPKVADGKGKKGAPKGPRKPRVRTADAVNPLQTPVTAGVQSSLLPGVAVNGAAASH